MRTLSSPSKLTRLATAGMILGLILTCASCSKKESVDSATSAAALTALGMDKNGENNLSWKSLDQNGADYTYKDVTFTPNGGDGDDDSIHIDTLVLSGVAMRGDGQASFTEFKASGITSEDGDAEMSLDSFVLTGPNAYTASLATSMISDIAAMDFDWTGLGFEKFTATDFTVESPEGEDGVIKLAQITVEDFSEDSLAKGALSGLSIDIPQDNIEMSVDDMTFEGINIAALNQVVSASGQGKGGLTALSAFSPYNPAVTDYSIKGLKFAAAGVKASSQDITLVSNKRGDVTTMTNTIAPITVEFTEEAGVGQMLRGLGYDNFVFTGSSIAELDQGKDRITLKDNHFTLEDGFTLKMDYDLGQYAKALEAQEAAIKASMDGADDEDGDMSYADIMSFQAGNKVFADTLTIHQAGLHFKDNGFTKRALDMAASLQGTTGERMAQQLTGMMLMASMTLQDDPQSKIMRAMIDAASEFIQDPQSLKVGLYPDEPQTAAILTMLSDPLAADDNIDFDNLGFVAVANGED